MSLSMYLFLGKTPVVVFQGIRQQQRQLPYLRACGRACRRCRRHLTGSNRDGQDDDDLLSRIRLFGWIAGRGPASAGNPGDTGEPVGPAGGKASW